MQSKTDERMTSAESILKAYEFAAEAHGAIEQKRKYSGEDYIVHPKAVFDILEKAGEKNADVLAASFLHDILEDVTPLNSRYDAIEIFSRFGIGVYNHVVELTNRYTKENYPTLNREERKKFEVQRITTISDGSLKIKLADIIDNTKDLAKNDPNFARVYLPEKDQMISAVYPRIIESKDNVLIGLYHRAKSQLSFSLYALSALKD